MSMNDITSVVEKFCATLLSAGLGGESQYFNRISIQRTNETFLYVANLIYSNIFICGRNGQSSSAVHCADQIVGDFKFINGKFAPPAAITSNQIRIYINSHESIRQLVAFKVAAALNRMHIPFSLKFYSGSSSRVDATVIYCERMHYSIIANCVLGCAGNDLNCGTPYFTLELAKGLALAESPSSGESFGMVMSQLCAKAFTSELLSGAPSTVSLINSLNAALVSHGYSVDHMYRNPGSFFTYNFSPL